MKNSELQICVLGSVSTNCYLLKNKNTGEVLIVDPADQAQEIFSKVKEMQAKPAAVLLTHGHYDHILAVEDVKKEYQIPVYACEKESGTLLDPSANLSGYGNRSCSLKADILLEDLQVFDAAGFSVQMIHTPGHTPGSCCYYLKDEGILFSGDTLFYGSVGRTDLPGGSTGQIVESLHRLTDSLPEETEVYPGHDISTTIGYEKRYNPFV
ncbi:MBL fold metallo-hydrolase [Blautia sp. XA-2221]|uniref:MBL fold metallo-hydrolase n=1 Tax=Blautia sp. XA-2221 TaxID=2903961 RepID=UPI002379C979|nr:MBL fold metallo-hydrolase [Blautia sp. XA-2221]